MTTIARSPTVLASSATRAAAPAKPRAAARAAARAPAPPSRVAFHSLASSARGKSSSLAIARAEGEDASSAAPPAHPANDDAAKIEAAVAEIKDYLKLLYVKREMNFNEVRLTLAIEDPRLVDRRERYGIEDESGVSADEKVAALEAIDAGEMPADVLVVEKLLDEFRAWPGLEDDATAAARRQGGASRYAAIANQAAGLRGDAANIGIAKEGDGDEEEEMDGNPFGFLVLYGVSAVPIFITIAALSIMFVNSLQ